MATATQKLLFNQLKGLKKNPVQGFAVDLVDESNIFEWKVYIEGPGETDYEGGIFQALMTFPKGYPYEPPSLKFTSDFWHPNVYKDGKVCISILHAPGEDETSGERPEERWLPTQTPETILLSVISLLSDPNISSPANVDASVEFRKKKKDFSKRVKKLVEKSKKELPKDFEMPKPKKYVPMSPSVNDPADFYYNDEYENEIEEDEDVDDEEEVDDDDNDDIDLNDPDIDMEELEKEALAELEKEEEEKKRKKQALNA